MVTLAWQNIPLAPELSAINLIMGAAGSSGLQMEVNTIHRTDQATHKMDQTM